MSSIFNKRQAFQKCVESQKFKAWHKLEVAKRLGLYNQHIPERDLKIEYYKPMGCSSNS